MSIFYPHEEAQLYHHGILGMKWGIRRFQPYSSGYHGKGKFVGKKAEDYKADKKIQKQLTTAAYSAGKFRAASERDVERLSKRRGLIPSFHQSRLDGTKDESRFWNREYEKATKQLEDHVSKMNKKYGKENVKQIEYTTVKGGGKQKQKIVAEPYRKTKNVLKVLGATGAAVALSASRSKNLSNMIDAAKTLYSKGNKRSAAKVAAGVLGSAALGGYYLNKRFSNYQRQHYKQGELRDYLTQQYRARERQRKTSK